MSYFPAISGEVTKFYREIFGRIGKNVYFCRCSNLWKYMCTYINKGNDAFKGIIQDAYVDKTGLIAVINQTLNTERRYTCVTRCRRFGKSMAVDMLCAYYDKSCDSRSLFEGLSISEPDKVVDGKMENKQYEEHLNKYPVICLDITDFTTKYKNNSDIVNLIQEAIIDDLLLTYLDIVRKEGDDLMDVLIRIQSRTGEKFIMIIDEWDAICREFSETPSIMDEYVSMLRRLFKGGSSKKVFAGVYMTGILPIKKYNVQSALNNFEEYSIVLPGKLDSYFGFTPSEVEKVAEGGEVSVAELRDWYDGYEIGKEKSLYNPYSVMKAVSRGYCSNFWESTSAYDVVSSYINRNFEGLKDDIIYMLGGGCCSVDPSGFENDPSIIRTKDDALTILIHLGYLAYNMAKKQCYIPNKEVRQEMEKAVKACNWEHLNKALNASEKLFADTLDMNEEAVAKGIELAHDEETSILSYNDENSLACVLSIAYYYAKNDYITHRELASGKGFADIVLIPRRNVDTPALVIELKYNKCADAAIEQIKRMEYPAKVAEYVGDILLVGINYDKETKKHSCKIERFSKK